MLTAVEHAVAPCYRKLRQLKNRALNLLDAPVVVLAYHRVTELPSDPHQLTVTPENFRAQMHHLRRNCHCLRIEDDWTAVREPAVVVTFDDGYADNFHQALPILEEAGVPATFFICTGTLGTDREFWSDDLERLLLGTGEYPDRFVLKDLEHGDNWPTANREQRLALHDRLHRCLLQIGARRREEWLEQLTRWSGAGRAGRDAYRALTPMELQALATSPLVTIGAHGVTHTPLAILSAAEQQEEIVRSKRRLEELAGRDVAVFAYPFGRRRDYSRTTCRICRAAGFRRAVTTLPGQVHRWTDPLQMPRQLVRNWDGGTFAARLEGFWT